MSVPPALTLRIAWTVTVDLLAGVTVVVGRDELQRDYRFEVPLEATRGLVDVLTITVDERPDVFPLTHTRPSD